MAAIEVTGEGAVANVLLNRPEKRNALRTEDWTSLRNAVAGLDPQVRCVVVTGAGGAFCAGWDLGQSTDAQIDAVRIVRDVVNPTLRAIRAIPVPTIAAVAGDCVGGGLGIAFACDIVLAEETARFGSPFCRIGIIPDTGIHHVMRERVGHHKASLLLHTGRLFDGREADRLGLVSEACAAGTVAARASDLAREIAAGPTAALRISKEILLSDAGYEEMLDMEAVGQGRAFATADAREGLSAFLEKRPPRFEGR